MPPKVKFSVDDVVKVAFDIVREKGWDALSARAVAEKLQSSTMPVFFHFKSMQSLEEEIIKKALDLLLEYQMSADTGDKILDLGIGYVLFARREKHLFRGMTEEKHSHVLIEYGRRNFDYLLNTYLKDVHPEGLSPEEQRNRFFVQWVFIHGLASLNNNTPIMDLLELDAVDVLKRVHSSLK